MATAGAFSVTFQATAEMPIGLRVNVSSPRPTNEFLVVIDGGAFGTDPQVSSIEGSSMTSGTRTLSVPVGSGYRIRAVSLEPYGSTTSFPVVLASGKVENISVEEGSLTEISLSLEEPTVEISAPDSVNGGETIEISWTYTDPGAVLDRSPHGLDGRVWHGSTSDMDLTGTQVSAQGTRHSETEFEFTASFTAPTTAGTLPFQVSAQIFQISIPGQSRSAWLVDPSLARDESRLEIEVR